MEGVLVGVIFLTDIAYDLIRREKETRSAILALAEQQEKERE